MEYRYLVTDDPQFTAYQEMAKTLIPQMDRFIAYLQSNYRLSELPKAVILSDAETATKLISNIPVPAYTNEYRTVFCPELTVWRKTYLHQLDGQHDSDIRWYYENRLSQNHLLQILGHEFVQHSDLFSDGFDSYYDSEVWFEEGMCEYISRKYFLTDEEFEAEAEINQTLVQQYESIHGVFSLADFGSGTYRASYADIFCGYWKSFLTVQNLIDAKDGNIMAVFETYHKWTRQQPLTTFFHIE